MESQVEIFNYSQWQLSTWIIDEISDHKWFFDGIYAVPKTSKRQQTWDLLREIKLHSDTPR